MRRREPMEYALYLLSRKPRTVKEMEIALKKRGVGEEQIEEIIEKLKDWRYLDDKSYAEEFVKFKMKKLYGPSYIRSELLKKGVKREIIDEAIEEFFDVNAILPLAVERAKKMLGESPDEKTRKKVWNYFARRGLPATEILNLALRGGHL